MKIDARHLRYDVSGNVSVHVPTLMQMKKVLRQIDVAKAIRKHLAKRKADAANEVNND